MVGSLTVGFVSVSLFHMFRNRPTITYQNQVQMGTD